MAINETLTATASFTTPLGKYLSKQSDVYTILDTSIGEYVIDMGNYSPMFTETESGFNGYRIHGSPNFWQMLTTLAGGAGNLKAGDKLKIIVPDNNAVVGRYSPFPVSGNGGANYPISGGRIAMYIGPEFNDIDVTVEIAGLVIGYGGGGYSGAGAVAATGGTGLYNNSTRTVNVVINGGQLCGGGGGGGGTHGPAGTSGGGAPYGPGGGGGGTSYVGGGRDGKFFGPGLGGQQYGGGNWGLPGGGYTPGGSGDSGFCYQGAINIVSNSGQLMGRIP